MNINYKRKKGIFVKKKIRLKMSKENERKMSEVKKQLKDKFRI